jgi:hypothetical protein
MGSQYAIGIENYFLNATILSYSSQAAASPAANLLNAFTWSKWQGMTTGGDDIVFDLGTAKPVDYFAVAEVNWPGYDGTITIQSSPDAVSWTTQGTIYAQSAPAAPFYEPVPRCMANAFPSVVTERYWRVVTSATSGSLPMIGVVAIGQWVVPDIGEFVGLAPPRNNRNVDTYNALSDTGNFLGRSVVDKGTRLHMTLDFLDPSWVNTYGNRLIRVLEIRPVFIAYPIINSAVAGGEQVGYLHSDGDIDPPTNSKTTKMKMSFKLRGIR